VSVVALIGITTTLFEKMSFYMEHKASFFYIIAHIFTRLPWWLMQALPIATLLALLFSLGNLSSKNEITAMKAAGINIWHIIALFLFMGFVIGTGELFAREFIIPKTEKYYEVVKREKIKKEAILMRTEFQNLIFALVGNSRLTVDYLNSKENVMKNVVIEEYDENFFITALILAETAHWENNSWILENVLLRDFTEDMIREKHFKNYDSKISLSPQILSAQNDGYDAMSTHDFLKYINRLKLFGQTAKAKYASIALNIRYSSACTHIIVMMVGIPFATSFAVKLNKILSFTLALLAVFVYWGTQMISRSLGENYNLSPFMTAWLANFIFFTAGVFGLYKIRK
jgi:lipopolysaccharide export system permease protein